MRLPLTVLVSLSALIAAAAPARADLISNGSFETASGGYSLPAPGESLAIGSTAIADWTVVGSSHDVEWQATGDFGITTTYGSYLIDLTGLDDTSPYSGLEQTITTTPGTSYSLSFELGVDQGTSFYGGPVSVVASAGSTSGTLTANPTGTGNIWSLERLDFTASSASTLIEISGSSTAGGQYIGLDDVSVSAVAAPEPGSLFVLAGGLLALAPLRRRRHRHMKGG